MAYRLSRNVEASIIDYIKSELVTDGWSNIRVEKSFAEVYKGTLPCICINVADRPDIRREVGSDVLSNYIDVDIRIFVNSGGLRIDLSDWMLEKVMPGVSYYTYTIVNGVVDTKTLAGRINFLRIVTNRKELRNTENLEQEDRYRQLMNFELRVSLI